MRDSGIHAVTDLNIHCLTVAEEFPKYGSNVTAEDYSIAKQSAAIACYIHREVEIHCQKQDLMRRAVHMYM